MTGEIDQTAYGIGRAVSEEMEPRGGKVARAGQSSLIM
jgi:hypothetical protein